LTASGTIALQRAYFVCACGDSGYLADDALGIDGYLTTQARRLACLAGAHESFAKAGQLLHELAGWELCDESIRQACHREARAMADWRAQSGVLEEQFGRATGEAEFQTDAAKVNTDSGWRDMKLGVFARRPLGESATPAQWDQRKLPRPTIRVAFAAIETIDVFGPRWQQWAVQLGLTEPSRLSILGDGAEWIWQQAQQQFPGARQCLDIFHACEHLGGAARELFGEGSAAAAAWLDEGRQGLLADGWFGLCEHIGKTLAADNASCRQTILDKVTAYFARHTERLGYCQRLYSGRAIGSGMVEGACKQLIVRRLKQTAARWTVVNANRMAELCCVAHGDCWAEYWMAA
jgi:hypothetical protein